MHNALLKARYTQQHKLRLIMNGNWVHKKDVIKKYVVDVPEYASITTSYHVQTDTTEVMLAWSYIDDDPGDMLQP